MLTSDDTYLRRYKFPTRDPLVNHLFAEGFRGRSYAQVNAYHFRGLRESDDQGELPIAFPILDYNFVGEPGRAGGRWSLDANLTALTRTSGTDSRRLSLKTGWELPHIARSGAVTNLYLTFQSDAYWVDEVQEQGRATGNLTSGFSGRLFPQLGLDWRFPFVRSDATVAQIIEPMAGIVVGPNGGNPDRIPTKTAATWNWTIPISCDRAASPGWIAWRAASASITA